MKKKFIPVLIAVLVLSTIFIHCSKKETIEVEPPKIEPKIEDPVIEEKPEPPKPEPKPLELHTIHFEFDQYDINNAAENLLNQNAEQLMERKSVEIKIEGHCDERGTNEYNLNLGEKRARAVKDFLVNYGINASRISTVSYGEERPLCTSSSEKCWAQNRRAKFIVTSE